MSYKPNLVYEVLTGSKLYGTDTPASDDDVRGLFIGPCLYMGEDTIKDMTQQDAVYTEMREFVQRLIRGSNQDIEILFSNKIFVSSEFMQPLLQARDIFLTDTWAAKNLGYIRKVLRTMKEVPAWTLIRKDIAHVVRVAEATVAAMVSRYTPVMQKGTEAYAYVMALKSRHELTHSQRIDIEEYLEDAVAIIDDNTLPRLELKLVDRILYQTLTSYWEADKRYAP